MSYVTASGKRRVYLINHDPVEAGKLDEMGWALSKFIALQTINEFRDGVYNDSITGELYASEESVLRHINSDEYYIELMVSPDAIAYQSKNGQVFINTGFAPKIVALKTPDRKIYIYHEEQGFCKKEKEKVNQKNRSLYNTNPDRWPLFAAERHHLPFSKILSLVGLAQGHH
jgi:hypothetical protein